MESKPPELARVLGAKDAAAIMISNMIGTGILTLPGLIAISFGATPAVLGAWAIGGLLSLAGALVQAELGCRYPLAGGDYVFLRAAYGELPAFLSGWTSFVIGFPGAIALAGMGAAQHFLDMAGLELARPLQVAFAAGILLAISLVHASGLEAGKWFQNVLTAIKIAILVAIIAAGLALFAPRAGDSVREAAEAAPFRLSPWVGALLMLFTYSGWNAAAYVAGEIRNPRRDLPLALSSGVILVTILYLLVNWTYVRVIPPESLAGTINVVGAVAKQLLGATARQVASGLVFFVCVGTASAMILTGPRIYYAMAQDRLLPRALTAVGATSRVPVRSLWVQTAWSIGILVAGLLLTPSQGKLIDTFEVVAGWTTYAILPFAALTTSSVFVFRMRDRGGDPPWKSPGYPWTAVAFVAAALAVTVLGFVTNSPEYRLRGCVGFVLVAAGVPAYALWKSLAGRASGQDLSRASP